MSTDDKSPTPAPIPPVIVGKKTTDFPNDNEVTGAEKIYAVDGNKDVNISTDQIKNYVAAEINKDGVATIKLSSVAW